MSGKTAFYGLMATVLAGLICLTAFELTARFFEEMDRYATTKEFDPSIGWRLKSGSYHVRPAGRLQSVPIHINRFYLRGDDFDAASEAGGNRIIVLGDSFVFARHFPLEQTFTGRMEKILNERAGAPVQVINAGVPGYGTGQELLLMKKLAEEKNLTAKTYLLAVFPNDILDNLRLSYGEQEVVDIKPGFKLDSDGKAVLDQLPSDNLSGLKESFRRPRQQNFWKPRSLFFIRQSVVDFFQSHPEWIRSLMKLGFKIELPRKPGLLNGWYDAAVVEQGLPLMKGLIREISLEAQKQGGELKVFMIPSPVQIYPELYRKILTAQFPDAPEVREWIADPLKAQRLVGEICGSLGIDYLDLYPVLKENSKRRLYLPRDGHFDADAHALTAEALAQWIEKGK